MIRTTRPMAWVAGGLLGAGVIAGAIVAVDASPPHEYTADAPSGAVIDRESGRSAVGWPGVETEPCTPSPTGETAEPIDLLRMRPWLRMPGMHAEVVVDSPEGYLTVATQRGRLHAVDGVTITVRSEDGVVQTWQVLASVRVRSNGIEVPVDSLEVGDFVHVVGLKPLDHYSRCDQIVSRYAAFVRTERE